MKKFKTHQSIFKTKMGIIRCTGVDEVSTPAGIPNPNPIGQVRQYLTVQDPEHDKKAGDVEYKADFNDDQWHPAASVDEAIVALIERT